MLSIDLGYVWDLFRLPLEYGAHIQDRSIHFKVTCTIYLGYVGHKNSICLGCLQVGEMEAPQPSFYKMEAFQSQNDEFLQNGARTA